MISAGKASATTIERSRTTNGIARQRPGRFDAPAGRRRTIASRSSSATKISSWRGAPRASAIAGASRPSTPTARRRRRRDRGRLARRRGTARVDALDADGDAERRRTPARRPLDVEEVDRPRAVLPVRRHARRSTPRPTPRVSPPRAEKRAPISNSATSRRPCRRLCATRVHQPGHERRAQHVELRRQRVGDGDEVAGSAANGSAACRSMKPNVTASDSPAAVSTRRTSASRGMRGSGGRRGDRLRGERRREPVEAVVPADLLDEVRLAHEVDAEGRRFHVPAVGRGRHRQPEARRIRVVSPSSTVAPSRSAMRLAAQVDARRAARPGIAIDDRAVDGRPAPSCCISAIARSSADDRRR